MGNKLFNPLDKDTGVVSEWGCPGGVLPPDVQSSPQTSSLCPAEATLGVRGP